MVLSVAGVLAAGTGALALNTSVLDSGGGAALEELQQSVAPVADTTLATTPDTVVSLAVDEPSAAPEVTTFVIGEAGTITVEVLDGRLTVVDITTNSGWSASPPRDVERDSAEVYFTSSTQKLEAEVEIRGGIAVVFVEDESGTSSSVPGRDDDHDDDDHDDDHDDDDYDDDDHDDDHDDD
jgi:hypothetical protein